MTTTSAPETATGALPGASRASLGTLPEGIVRLDDWGVIRAAGDDAGAFLQGQLTNDVLGFGPGRAALAGFCSPKGRLLATFVIWRESPTGFLLACSTDLLPAVLKRLSMFVMRARCKLGDASGEVPLWGIAGPVAAASLRSAAHALPARAWERDGALVGLPDAIVSGQRHPRWLLAGDPDAAFRALPALGASSWRWLEALSATPRIVAATADQFVPQMVNLEVVGGVSFSKGCYPGQEVVARSQYRGTLKRRGFVIEGDEPLAPGQELFHDADPQQPAGMVVNAGSHGPLHGAFAELKLGLVGSAGALHVGSADGPVVRLLDLPYALPAADAA